MLLQFAWVVTSNLSAHLLNRVTVLVNADATIVCMQ